MIKIPEPIHDTTGGDEILKLEERWADLCEDVNSVIKDEIGESQYQDLMEQGNFEIHLRNLSSRHGINSESDDYIGEFIFTDKVLAGYYNYRTDGNMEEVLFFSRTEEQIRKIVR